MNVVAVAMCENAIVKRILRALELQPNVWLLIEVRRSWKKIGKSRRNTIGLLGNKNDRPAVDLFEGTGLLPGNQENSSDEMNRIEVKKRRRTRLEITLATLKSTSKLGR